MAVLFAPLKTFQKSLKKLTKLPKTVKKAAKKLPKFPLMVYGMVKKVVSKVAVLPLDTFSGKALFVTLLLAVASAVSWIAFRSQGLSPLETAFVHAGVGAVASAAVFVVSYPLDRKGWIEAALVRSGIRQRMRLSTVPGALAWGLVVAVPLTVYVDYLVAIRTGSGYGLAANLTGGLGTRPEPEIAVVFLVAFVLAVLVMLYLIRRKSRLLVHSDLSVDDVIVDEDDSCKEVVLRNEGEDVVSISGAKLVDADGLTYVLEEDLRLRPGEKSSIEIPQGFVLQSESGEGAGGSYEKNVTSIYARTGDTYPLEQG